MPTKAKNKPMPARRLAPGQIPTRRTRVANGSALLVPEGNANGWWARRFAEILSLRLDDLGDCDVLSESQVSFSKRATTLEVELEAMDAKLSTGADVEFDLYGRLTGTLAHVLEKLGLERRQRTIVSPIADHFARPYDILRDREAERDALLAMERCEAEAGAASLVDRIKAGRGVARPEASRDAIAARTKRAEVEHHIAEATLALAALDDEHVKAVEDSTCAEKEHVAAVNGVVLAEAEEIGNSVLADLARLKWRIADFNDASAAGWMPGTVGTSLGFALGPVAEFMRIVQGEREGPAPDFQGYVERLRSDPDAIPA